MSVASINKQKLASINQKTGLIYNSNRSSDLSTNGSNEDNFCLPISFIKKWGIHSVSDWIPCVTIARLFVKENVFNSKE